MGLFDGITKAIGDLGNAVGSIVGAGSGKDFGQNLAAAGEHVAEGASQFAADPVQTLSELPGAFATGFGGLSVGAQAVAGVVQTAGSGLAVVGGVFGDSSAGEAVTHAGAALNQSSADVQEATLRDPVAAAEIVGGSVAIYTGAGAPVAAGLFLDAARRQGLGAITVGMEREGYTQDALGNWHSPNDVGPAQPGPAESAAGAANVEAAAGMQHAVVEPHIPTSKELRRARGAYADLAPKMGQRISPTAVVPFPWWARGVRAFWRLWGLA